MVDEGMARRGMRSELALFAAEDAEIGTSGLSS